jgi:hypothetical protein
MNLVYKKKTEILLSFTAKLRVAVEYHHLPEDRKRDLKVT